LIRDQARSVGRAVAIAVGTSLALTGAPAHATVYTPCRPWLIQPAFAQRVPANIPSFEIGPAAGDVPPKVRLFRVSPSGASPVALSIEPIYTADLRFRLRPSALYPGFTYRFEYPRECEGLPVEMATQTFEVGPDAPLPSALGRLSASELRSSINAIGVTEYRFDVTLSLADEIAPWLESFQTEVAVDGRTDTSFGYHLLREGAAALPACGYHDEDLPTGIHRVAVTARPTGFDAAVVTTNVLSFDLACPNDRPEFGPDDPPEEVPLAEDGGCSIQPLGPSAESAWLLAIHAGLMALALAARRRRDRTFPASRSARRAS
jgi:hypothetical protein